MFRVIKQYSKGLRFFIVLVACFLFVQAQCELSLPDYMSNIVTYGIQNKGIDYQIPKVLDEKTYKTLVHMSDNEQVIKKAYTLKKSNDDSLIYSVNQDKVGKKVYELKSNLSNHQQSQLEKNIKNNILVIESFKNANTKDKDLAKQLNKIKKQLPPNMKINDLLLVMPKQQIKMIQTKIDKQFEDFGDTTLKIANSSAISQLYKEMGIDTDNIQFNYILMMGFKMLLVAVGAMLCAVLVNYLAAMIASKISMRMRNDIFEKVVSFSHSEMEKFSTSSLITRTTNDVQQIQFALIQMLRIVFFSPIMAIGAIIKVINSSVSMVWIIGVIVIIIMGVIATLMMIVSPRFMRMQKLIDKMNLVIRESLSGMMVIRAFANESKEEQRFDKANQDITENQLKATKVMSLMMPIISFIMNVTAILIVWVGSHQINDGTLQIGEMMAFIQYAMNIIMSFMMIAMISVVLPRAGVAAKRCFEVIDTKLSISDPDVEVNFDDHQQGVVEFKNVSFKYPDANEYVLKDISFTAKPNQTTAFIGSTGSGKSSIVNLVPRFYDVSEGQILIDGVDIRDIKQKTLRDKIGMVVQNASLFKGTIKTNVKYSDPKMDDSVMKEALEIAQADFVLSKENTYDSEISQKGSNVSGGQRQRLAIARAIAKHPEIYVFDDSFSALDFKTDAKVRKGLQEVCKKDNSTILLIAQRVATIMDADQIIVLDEGKIVGKGTHQELLKTCDVYYDIASSQLSKEELDYEEK